MPRRLRTYEALDDFSKSRSGRMLQVIRRDMDLKDELFRARKRNEQILGLTYQDSGIMGGDYDWENIRENALNLPYRYVRWIESQAISKKLVVKVNRDAGEGQRPGGPADTDTGMWVGISLVRIAYAAGFKREIKALIGEVIARGTSVMRIGYHEQSITLETSEEVGKDAQSVVPEVLAEGDMQPKPGQDHVAISEGLARMAEDQILTTSIGQDATQAIIDRKDAHDQARLQDEKEDIKRESVRFLRRKIHMRKMRVGVDVGWAPWVYDTQDTPIWWERNVWTVAEVKKSDLFTKKFKGEVEGYDGRNLSGVMRSGKTPETDEMGADARTAQSEDVLGDDEKMVEWFRIWFANPDIPAGGTTRIVCAETPDEFIENDDSNPFVDKRGVALIPGFFPFYDFTPIMSSLTVPERTCGIPAMAVGMGQFERIAEYNRLRQEGALKGATRLYQLHPGLKDSKKVMDAINNGEVGYAFISPPSLIDKDGKMMPAIITHQFTGTDPEIDRQAASEKSDWVMVQAMPPAVLQGVGTAKTATQDSQGIAAGERESGLLVSYLEDRVSDMLAGIRGLMRGNYDDEDFIRMLGEEGAKVMKAWQIGTVDDGDEITAVFGANSQAQELADKKQLIEAISLKSAQVDPVTGLREYDIHPDIEELNRRFDLGAPKLNEGLVPALQQRVMQLEQMLQRLLGEAEGGGASPTGTGGPRPAEGDGPTQGNLLGGPLRGTVNPEQIPAGV